MEATQQTKNCHYCNKEILAQAKKCKHCGKWLEENIEEQFDDNDENYLDSNYRWLKSFGLAAAAWALFHFGGWHFVLGKKVSIFLQYLYTGQLKSQDLIWDKSAIAFRINDGYWGFVRDERFFDAPVIQWFMLSFSIMAIFYALKILIFGEND
jgi:hypothetical protein